MSNLKEVRIRIDSVKSTQQITSAMKMVAASKLRKAQNAILKLRPYAAKLIEIIQDISLSLENSNENIYSQQRDPEKILLIVIASNRGLCGAFNSNIIKAANKLITTQYTEQFKSGNLYLICIGKKVSEFYSKKGYQVIEVFDNIFDSLTYVNVATVAEKLMTDFADMKYDRIEIIYNQFKNAAVQKLLTERFLPIEPLDHDDTKETNFNADFIFEPDKVQILNELIPKTLKIQLFKALLDSYASEHGARMTAMHQATDNAQGLIKELNLSYNKARQAAITKEILEIVSGAEALKG